MNAVLASNSPELHSYIMANLRECINFVDCRVGIAFEYSVGELLTRAAFMHHDGIGHDTPKQHVALRVFNLTIVHIHLHFTTTGHGQSQNTPCPPPITRIYTHVQVCVYLSTNHLLYL